MPLCRKVFPSALELGFAFPALAWPWTSMCKSLFNLLPKGCLPVTDRNLSACPGARDIDARNLSVRGVKYDLPKSVAGHVLAWSLLEQISCLQLPNSTATAVFETWRGPIYLKVLSGLRRRNFLSSWMVRSKHQVLQR